MRLLWWVLLTGLLSPSLGQEPVQEDALAELASEGVVPVPSEEQAASQGVLSILSIPGEEQPTHKTSQGIIEAVEAVVASLTPMNPQQQPDEPVKTSAVSEGDVATEEEDDAEPPTRAEEASEGADEATAGADEATAGADEASGGADEATRVTEDSAASGGDATEGTEAGEGGATESSTTSEADEPTTTAQATVEAAVEAETPNTTSSEATVDQTQVEETGETVPNKKQQKAVDKYNEAVDQVLRILSHTLVKAEGFPLTVDEETLTALEGDGTPAPEPGPEPEPGPGNAAEEKKKKNMNKRRRKENKKNKKKNKNNGEAVEESDTPIKRNKNKKNKDSKETSVEKSDEPNNKKGKNKNRNKNKSRRNKSKNRRNKNKSRRNKNKNRRNKNKGQRNKNKGQRNKNKKENIQAKGVEELAREDKSMEEDEDDMGVLEETVEDVSIAVVEGRRKVSNPRGKNKKGKRKGNKNNKGKRKGNKNKKNKRKNSKSRSEAINVKDEVTGPVYPTQEEVSASNAQLAGFTKLARVGDVSVDHSSSSHPLVEVAVAVGPLQVQLADRRRALTKSQVSATLNALARFRVKKVRGRERMKLLKVTVTSLEASQVNVLRSDLTLQPDLVSAAQDQVVQAVDVARIGRILSYEIEAIFAADDLVQNLENHPFLKQ